MSRSVPTLAAALALLGPAGGAAQQMRAGGTAGVSIDVPRPSGHRMSSRVTVAPPGIPNCCRDGSPDR